MESLTIAATEASAGALVQGATLADLFARFIAYIDAKQKTVETYQKAVKQFLGFLAIRGVSAPVREDVTAWRDNLKAEHKPTTVRTYLTAVKIFFKWLEGENLYKDVANRVKGPKVSKDHKKDYLTSNQSANVLGAIDASGAHGKRDFALVALMLTTGLRTIEITRARLEDLRTVGDCVALYVQGKGKDEKADFVKIAPQVEKAIRDYLATRGKLEASAPLFASDSNHNAAGVLTTRSVSRIVKERLKAAGYDSERLTAHSLRHTAATLNLLAGASLEETQQLLRHSNINTTMIYSHALERAKNNSEMRIAGAIFGGA